MLIPVNKMALTAIHLIAPAVRIGCAKIATHGMGCNWNHMHLLPIDYGKLQYMVLEKF